MFDIAIVGGGASGLMAALAAQKTQSLQIVLIEQLQRIGSKILATGNGKCNLSNVNADTALHGRNKQLIDTISSSFSPSDTIQFFHEIGLQCTIHSSGRVYPYSMQASSVIDILHNAVNRHGVVIKCNTAIVQIEKTDGHFRLHSEKGETIISKKIILATGGKAMPSLGSTGSGYGLARQMGHNITKTFPALVKLKTDDKRTKGMAGIRVNATVGVVIEDILIGQENGEVQFTQQGLSGIPIMQISHYWGEKREADSMFVILDFMPDYTRIQLFNLLIERKGGTVQHFSQIYFWPFDWRI